VLVVEHIVGRILVSDKISVVTAVPLKLVLQLLRNSNALSPFVDMAYDTSK
jgi:hypothetical protein